MRRHATAALILCICLLGASPAAAQTRGKGYAEALEAKASVQRAAERRAAQAREERHAARWVRRWTRAYGRDVGRWADDALSVGWHDDEMWTLGRIILHESGGRPRATNGQYRGILQFSSYWYAGYWSFNPYSPKQSLYYGRRLKRMLGWTQWSTY